MIRPDQLADSLKRIHNLVNVDGRQEIHTIKAPDCLLIWDTQFFPAPVVIVVREIFLLDDDCEIDLRIRWTQSIQDKDNNRNMIVREELLRRAAPTTVRPHPHYGTEAVAPSKPENYTHYGIAKSIPCPNNVPEDVVRRQYNQAVTILRDFHLLHYHDFLDAIAHHHVKPYQHTPP